MPRSKQLTSSQIVSFIKSKKQYRHCRKLTNISELKTGVHLAEILCQCPYMNDDYYHLLLPNIQIADLTVDKCIHNFKVIIDVLMRVLLVNEDMQLANKVGQYRPEVIYYKQEVLRSFMCEIVIPLCQNLKKLPEQNSFKQISTNKNSLQFPTYTSMAQKSQQLARHSANENNISQLSQIINTSNFMPDTYHVGNLKTGGNSYNSIKNSEYYEINNQQPMPINEDLYKDYQKDEGYQEQIYQPIIVVNEEEIEILENWIISKLTLSEQQAQDIFSQPDQVLGLLINTLFCQSRLTDPIIKQAHFLQGPIFIYRKSLNFILENPLTDRVNKFNAMQMLHRIDKQNIVNQNQFWAVIRDLHEYDIKKLRRQRIFSSNKKARTSDSDKKQSKKKQQSKKNSKQTQIQHEQNKQNIQNIQNQLHKKGVPTQAYKNSKNTIKTQQSKKTLQSNNRKPSSIFEKIVLKYSAQQLEETERWIHQQLGYSYSLSKSKQYNSDICKSPLLNGSLMASIAMRLKIGKINLIKDTKNQKQVFKNWEQIAKICALRGYQCFKTLQFIQSHQYRIYLGLLHDFKKQYQKLNPKKQPTQQQPSAKPCNICQATNMQPHPLQQISSHRQQIQKWLLQSNLCEQEELKKQSMLPISIVTSTYKKILNINIYRETTKKIQANNIEKILAELRRLGFSYYYDVTAQNVYDCEKMLNDELRWRILGDLMFVVDGKICYAQ